MTIKRRIFLSNILMIILTIAVGGIIFLAVRTVTVADYTRGGPGGRFTDFTHIPIATPQGVAEALETGQLTYQGAVSLYRSYLGDFVVILPDAYYGQIQDFLTTPGFVLPGIVVYLMVVALLGNILIAKHIANRITVPINTLAHGVHEIASGNLTHRIHHPHRDEFDAVCANFNEMALKLSQMVAEKQADENSRKELIAGISHDLRTPLTSIKAYIEGLRTGVAKTPAMEEKYLSIIQTKTQDMEYIIQQLFLFSKIDIGDFPLNIETVDIGAKLAEIATAFRAEHPTLDLALTQNVQDTYVAIDNVQFKNIMENILSNSLKYANTPHLKVTITCEKTNQHLTIQMADNGQGVPPEMLPKLFNVFYRGDAARNNPGQGSGLGLAIAAKIIKRFNGHIAPQNLPGGGFAITMTLPIEKIEKEVPHEKNTHH